jgi:hypothetical protein
MLARLRSRLSSAHIISLIALFVALGGTGYAAVTLPRNSVGGSQLKPNSVSSSKVKNGALQAVDFKAGQLPAGAKGDTGAKGDKGDKGDPGTNGTNGANGTADAYVRVQPNGDILPNVGTNFPPTTKGVVQTNIEKPAATPGTYCIKGLPPVASAMVSSDNAGASAAAANDVVVSVAVERGNGLGGCATTPQAQLRVVTTEVAAGSGSGPAAMADKGFILWLQFQH